MAKEIKDQFDVIVIGSGVSGLGAASSLNKMGKSVVILEAKDYAGGRIRTVEVGGVKCDLGATWIEGTHNNPIAKMAKEFGVTTCSEASSAEDEVAFDQTTNKRFDFDRIEEYIDEFIDDDYLVKLRRKLPRNASTKDGLEKFSEEKKLDDFEQRIASYAIEDKHIGMEYGTSSRRVSLEYFEEEDEMDGDYVVFPSGFSQIIDGLAKDLDIRLSTPIKNIDYSGKKGVIVTTNNDESFYAKQVIVTASIGVLKSNIIDFNPPLPKPKTDALSRLEMAVNDKIILTFDEKFWNGPEIAFVASNTDESMNYWDFTYATGVPTLFGNFTGDSPCHHMTDEELVKLCHEQLSLTFNTIKVPQPTDYRVTRWQADPYSQGSFSFIPIGASFKDMKTLAKSIDNKVFFAGEGTNHKYFGTTHGAFMSGLRAAREINKNKSRVL